MKKIRQKWKDKNGQTIILVGFIDEISGENRVSMTETKIELLKNGWEMENEAIEEVLDRPMHVGKLNSMD